MRILRWSSQAILFICVLGLALTLKAQDAVPSSRELDSAREEVRSFFKDEFSRKDTKSKMELAEKLIEQSGGEPDPATKFVLLTEASELGTQVSSLKLVVEALDQLTEAFQINKAQYYEESFNDLLKKKLSLRHLDRLTKKWIELAEDEIKVGNIKIAGELLKGASKASRKTKDPYFDDLIDELEDLIDEYKKDEKKVQIARDKLESNPDDAEAQFELGKFELWYQQDLDGAIEKLLAGPQGDPLADVARLDQAALEEEDDVARTDPAARAWWKLAQAQKRSWVNRLYARRALMWHKESLKNLDSLIAKSRVQKTIAEIREHLKTDQRIDLDNIGVQIMNLRKRRWEVEPLETITLTRKSKGALALKHTANGFAQANVVFNQSIRGDFEAEIEVSGARKVGLISSRGYYSRSGGTSIDLGKGTSKIKVVGKDGKVIFKINGKEKIIDLDSKSSRYYSTYGNYLYVQINKSTWCTLSKFNLESDSSSRRSSWRDRREREKEAKRSKRSEDSSEDSDDDLDEDS